MRPIRQSIFHLGEEGGAAAVHHRGSLVGAAAMSVGVGVRRVRERERLVVGLQILVHNNHHHHHRGGRGHHAHAPANVVLKPMVRPRAAALSCCFLKACALCRLELSPDKDVYMYRGDQGFCSEECRWQQILVDEARERDAAEGSKERLRRGARHHTPNRTPPVVRGSRPPRKTLAVAY